MKGKIKIARFIDGGLVEMGQNDEDQVMDVGDFLETQRNELPCKNHCKFLGMRRSTAII